MAVSFRRRHHPDHLLSCLRQAAAGETGLEHAAPPPRVRTVPLQLACCLIFPEGSQAGDLRPAAARVHRHLAAQRAFGMSEREDAVLFQRQDAPANSSAACQ